MTFSDELGTSLPNHGSLVMASVDCDGPRGSSCKGVVSIFPRGKAQDTLGTRPLAAKFVRLGVDGDGDRILKLRPAARAAIAKAPLPVTVRIQSEGTAPRSKPAWIAKPHLVHVNPKPTGTGTMRTKTGSTNYYRWSWRIKLGSYINVRDFRCPESTPRVEVGKKVKYGWAGHIDINADDGTGYSGFDQAHTGPEYLSGERYVDMRGWKEGTWAYNSIWAPVYKGVGVELKVWCTDADSDSAAHTNPGTTYLLFPWKT